MFVQDEDMIMAGLPIINYFKRVKTVEICQNGTYETIHLQLDQKQRVEVHSQ